MATFRRQCCSASASAPKATSKTASRITSSSMKVRRHDHDHDEFDSFVVELGAIADPKASSTSSSR
jgi:hypothetical protein